MRWNNTRSVLQYISVENYVCVSNEINEVNVVFDVVLCDFCGLILPIDCVSLFSKICTFKLL